MTHGDEKGDNTILAQASGLYRELLRERTREGVPLDWAMTQNNLGTGLQTLGEQESGTGRLEEAVAAYREALKEYTRERVPLHWATTQNNLGTALRTLGERESGTGRLEEARGAIRLAWDVYREARIDQYNPSFETRLRSIDDLMAKPHRIYVISALPFENEFDLECYGTSHGILMTIRNGVLSTTAVPK